MSATRPIACEQLWQPSSFNLTYDILPSRLTISSPALLTTTKLPTPSNLHLLRPSMQWCKYKCHTATAFYTEPNPITSPITHELSAAIRASSSLLLDSTIISLFTAIVSTFSSTASFIICTTVGLECYLLNISRAVCCIISQLKI